MDSREDEQERGITMKSSAISLTYFSLKCVVLLMIITNKYLKIIE
jgi:translation elongation factor EF-G